MRALRKDLQSWWDKKVPQYPHLALAPSTNPSPHKVDQDKYGDFISVGAEKKGHRMWGFMTEAARDLFVSDCAQASKL